MWTFYEFFAGGGMARMGLGEEWSCLMANDWDKRKGQSYVQNWGDEDFILKDIKKIESKELVGSPDLVWGSFPCQDLSLAGKGAGLGGERSGTFWPFVEIIGRLKKEKRAPKIIVLENVVGTLSSHKGKDFLAIGEALSELGYRFGAMVINASLFIPQSRPRLFIVALQKDLNIPKEVKAEQPNELWHTKSITNAISNFSEELLQDWVWWNMPTPKKRKLQFIDIIEEVPQGVKWHTPDQIKKLLGMMSSVNLEKVENAIGKNERVVGGIYKRTRPDGNGGRVQRAEVRFDNVAGCLRTPGGGSSRQIIMLIEKGEIRTRLLSPREAARLMGLPDSYILPEKYNDAYHLVGDGLVVPVVNYLSQRILVPLMKANSEKRVKTLACSQT